MTPPRSRIPECRFRRKAALLAAASAAKWPITAAADTVGLWKCSSQSLRRSGTHSCAVTSRGQNSRGKDRLASDPAGVDDDAVWVAAEVDKQVAESHEDPDGPYLGYRPFTFPRDRLNNFSWRVVGE